MCSIKVYRNIMPMTYLHGQGREMFQNAILEVKNIVPTPRLVSFNALPTPVNWCSHCGKPERASSKKLKREMPYDPGIQCLGGIRPKELKAGFQRDVCTPMVTAA